MSVLSHLFIFQECNIEEVSDEEEPPSKSSKDKKANGPDSKGPSLVFKITSKVPYKTVLKGISLFLGLHTFFLGLFLCIFNCMPLYLAAHSAVVLKAESLADKVEWINKISKVAQPSKGGQTRGAAPEGGLTMRQSLSDGSLVCILIILTALPFFFFFSHKGEVAILQCG